MPKVANLSIKAQSGSSGTHYASWDFYGFAVSADVEARNITAGTLVTIVSGATYYNGVHIPDWVMSDKWYVYQIKGDRAVINKNSSGSHEIMSPINVKNLKKVGDDTPSGGTNLSDTLDHYEVTWYYDTGDGIWFSGDSSSVTVKNATYSAPSNAIRIKVSVKPVSKTHKVNDTDVSYWTGSAVSAVYAIAADPPEKTSAPSVSVEKYKLTASIENISDPRTDKIKFEIYNGTKLYNSGIVKVLTCRATYTCNVEAGGEYRVRCASININNNTNIYGEWSEFSSSVSTIPSTPSGITSCKASSKTSVHLEWAAVSSATSYDIEYTTKKEYFDGSDKTTTITGVEYTRYEKTGLESGNEYFFRVRATNDKGSSAWSGIKSVIIGTEPSAPTTWASTTTAITGEALTLYWMHNSEDNSSQTYAELELTINGTTKTYTIKNTEDEDEKDKTSSYAVNTSQYAEGSTIQWRVRTAGVTKTYGDWSIQRTIDIYAPATLTMGITNSNEEAISSITSFPFYVSALAGPKTQAPISYHLTITSDEIYQTVDQVGNVKMVNKGEEVYSKYFDTSEALLVELSANSVDLENGVSYTVTCLVAMNSGLTAEASATITVNWSETGYDLDAEIGIDDNTYSAYIRPYCYVNDHTKATLAENVTLSIYRREFDGTFVEIASGLENGRNIHVTDPHPALDYARYRVVATENATGAVTYYDPPGYPVQCKSIVIQWSEAWSSFETSNGDAMAEPAWAGSMLILPYNVDVSENNTPDVEMFEYTGRSRPVSYYGTQLGSSATWNVDVPKTDKETIYALRRLSIWMGDVYVREPSGSGYWAHLTVSFSQKHKTVVVPVTLSITRVEGGM